MAAPEQDQSFVDRLSRQGEEALGKIAEELPEVRTLALDPVLASAAGAFVTGARVVLGPPPTRNDGGPRRLG